jgi:hypothetical protein
MGMVGYKIGRIRHKRLLSVLERLQAIKENIAYLTEGTSKEYFPLITQQPEVR